MDRLFMAEHLTDKTLGQIRLASRRGMLELDLVLKPYVDNNYAQATPEEKKEFQALLACEDQDLFHWLIKKQSALPAYRTIIKKVLAAKENCYLQSGKL